jgi:hypothetical protein
VFRLFDMGGYGFRPGQSAQAGKWVVSGDLPERFRDQAETVAPAVKKAAPECGPKAEDSQKS